MELDRPIYLNGMMGSGKSVVGRAAAQRANVPFVELDEQIERRAGMTIAKIFEAKGEAAFRAMERALVDEQLEDRTPRVVAVGGGSLLNRVVRLRALERVRVITLVATVPELLKRLAGDRTRPMLAAGAGNHEGRIAELLEARAAAYSEAHATINVTGRSVDELAGEVLDTAGRDVIAVALGERSYSVDIAPGDAAERLERALRGLAPSCVVHVTDDVVHGLLGGRLAASLASQSPAFTVVLPTGERHKTLASVERILRAAVEAPIDRGAVVVGVGGGVITDMAGFAAAVALRGIRWVGVPTTVLAMVDASVGGKTGVDLGAAKNAVGAFHQPARVIVDPTLTQTESARAVRSGLAEVVKTALIGDASLYEELAATGGAERLAIAREPAAMLRAIRSSVAVKAGVVSRDERESGERAHLNLGHTVGHALEAHGGFEKLTHGEAVALGLVAALRVGVALDVTPRDLASDVVRVLERLGLPHDPGLYGLEQALPLVAYDKKRQKGALRMILVKAPGLVQIATVAPDDLPKLLRPF